MAASFKVLSALLDYPTAPLQQAAPQLAAVLRAEQILSGEQIAALAPLLEQLGGDELIDLQERYVGLFDRTRSYSLHLFEHVHGESRDRGQALVDLQAMYAQQGFEIKASELPDYLPLFLEFLSLLPDTEALELLAQPGAVMVALAARLQQRESVYAPVLAALVALAGTSIDAAPVAELLEQPVESSDDLEALDAAWESEAVGFGPGAATRMPNGGCGTAAGSVVRVPVPKVPGARSTFNG
jgi:nitrate reductase delta subunit